MAANDNLRNVALEAVTISRRSRPSFEKKSCRLTPSWKRRTMTLVFMPTKLAARSCSEMTWGAAAQGINGVGTPIDDHPALVALNESAVPEELTSGGDGHGGGAKVEDKKTDNQVPPIANPWPKPHDPAALHGICGKFVRLVEPESEADPAGLLVELLVSFGNLIGRNIYRRVGPVFHYTNLADVLVGPTGFGRKGTTWAEVRKVLDFVDPAWTAGHIVGGLSSGEGLIWIVRDPITRLEKDVKTGGYREIEVDAGVADKRMLIVENEFARTLKACDRRESILSAVIRQAWDSGDLQTINKNSPARSTGAHISIIGHITAEELTRYLNSTEAANGFANRITWNCVRRSKLLPFGGSLTDADFNPLVAQLRKVIEWARTPREIVLAAEARDAWATVYPKLTEGHPGLLGAILGRAEAQVLRYSILYAALDCSVTVELVHLRAALAVWDRAEASARYIFGQRLGDPDADAILDALRNAKEGLTRTEIRDIFSRHFTSGRIEHALAALRQANLAAPETIRTSGRPVERWRCVKRK